jgi:hypothetical protein
MEQAHMKDPNHDRVLGRVLAVEEMNSVSGAATPQAATMVLVGSDTTTASDSNTLSDSGTTADSGTTSDSGTATDTSARSDSGTAIDTRVGTMIDMV